MGKKKKCLIQEERKDLKGLSGIVLPFQIELILERKIYSWYIRARYPYKKWIKVEGMGFEPTNP